MSKKPVKKYKASKEFLSNLHEEIMKESLISSGSKSKGNLRKYKISEDSMKPAILIDDIVTIDSVGLNELKVGNLIMLSIGGHVVLRRVARFIVDETEMYVVTRSDWLDKEEPPAKDISVVGRVVGLERNGKEMKVPDTSSLMDAISSFKYLPPKKALKETILRLLPFTSG